MEISVDFHLFTGYADLYAEPKSENKGIDPEYNSRMSFVALLCDVVCVRSGFWI